MGGTGCRCDGSSTESFDRDGEATGKKGPDGRADCFFLALGGLTNPMDEVGIAGSALSRRLQYLADGDSLDFPLSHPG